MQILILSAFLVFICLVGFVVYFVAIYNKKQIQNKQEQASLQAAFQQELLKTQNEIQEQTLTHVSREIHDNITQVLSFVKLNLAMTGDLNETDKADKINESRKLVAQVITDLRDLSKSMSFEHIANLGLAKTIAFDVDRINKSGLLKAMFIVAGDALSLGDERELVLFRIFQEALNNSLKHSGAKHLKISLQYSEQLFNLTIADDGIGFLTGDLTGNGSGLKNITDRATLIGATATIDSEPGKGCCVKITIDPLLQQPYADPKHPDSTG
ncbi:sensor histidine kinase [Mucilaginibacter sp. ZB1P21]|uniref:histidine kinase n=2 Tax=Mucilaginibacter glaciei TaxID=2772109 RepID=A0A926NPG6_9SPHI|nr:sensor histidine kinase [Mucilaginibacter glaciei]